VRVSECYCFTDLGQERRQRAAFFIVSPLFFLSVPAFVRSLAAHARRGRDFVLAPALALTRITVVNPKLCEKRYGKII
jgi:hypothetical protein